MIDNKIVEQARNADIIAFLEQRYGFEFVRRSGSYRCKQHTSLAVKDDRLSWYWHSKGIGGFGLLDYLRKVENMPFIEAVEAVYGIQPTSAQPQKETEKPKILILPEKTEISGWIYDYLGNKRGIDVMILNALVEKKMLYEDIHGNVVFVGYNEHNKPRFACLRGTHSDFRGDCAGSDKRYSFSVEAYIPSERLYIYESPIDLMSHASIENFFPFYEDIWQDHHRLSLSGTSDTAIPFFLNKHNEVKELVFCLDNDPAGREAAVNMAKKYAYKGFITRLELPKNKDYNEDLLESIEATKILYKNKRRV